MTNEEKNERPPEKDWTKNLWVVLLDVMARGSAYLGNPKLAQNLYLWASDVCVYDRDHYGAAFMAEKAGDYKGAISDYINAGLADKWDRLDAFHRAERLALVHRIEDHDFNATMKRRCHCAVCDDSK